MNDGIPSSIKSIGKWFATQSPHLGNAVHSVYRRYTRLHIRYLQQQYGISEYDAPINRRQLLWVDPQKIRRVNDPGFNVKRDTVHEVIGGDWDKNLPEFNEVFPYQSFEKHFVDEVPWEDTEMYAWVQQIIRTGRTWGRCTTMSEADNRFDELDTLYNNIKKEGYKTRRELVEEGGTYPFDRDLPPPYERYEIKIDIGRDGELIFEDGRHRLAIAKVLALDTIPVYVLVRHQRWQQKRDRYYHSQDQTDTSHPDLQLLRS